MHAIITDGSISKYINHPKSLVIGDVRYPARIFSVWTASELAAIGIYEITFDDSKKKDEKYYINTNQTFTYDADAGTVTATYGDATAKTHADTTWTQDEIDNVISGLEGISDGGAALTAYGKLQFEEISERERGEIERALLKYCELDTLAMVMIYESWKEMINE